MNKQKLITFKYIIVPKTNKKSLRKTPFCTCHFHKCFKKCFWSKKISNFMHGFKSGIEKLPKPMHEIWNFFWPQAIFWSIMKMTKRKKAKTCPRVRKIQDLFRTFPKVKLLKFKTFKFDLEFLWNWSFFYYEKNYGI